MKKLFLLFALMGMVAVGCSKDEEGKIFGDYPENIFFALDKESITFSPDGGSVDIVVYSNYKWEISGISDWCAPSVKAGDANEDGQKVTFTADVAYDDREAIFWFRCADEKIKFVASQKFKEAIIPDANNTFDIPAEGGTAVISYQTTVDCDVIIPEEAQEWITVVPALRGLVSENINLGVAENTTYSARTAVVKVVAKDNASLIVEYTIHQAQNDAILADENNTFTVPSEGGDVVLDYQTNVDCEVIIPEEAKDWIAIVPEVRSLVSKSATLHVAENTTYSARAAVVKVVAKDNSEVFAEYTINQAQKDAVLADKNTTFTVPSEGGDIVLDYQTNIDCEVIIPEEAKDWIAIVPEVRSLVSKSATLRIYENTTYSARTAVVKVVAKDNSEVFAEYTIKQAQNDAVLADENNTFTVPGAGGEVVIKYQTNVACDVIIPEEAQDWISIAPATRGLVTCNATLIIAANNSDTQRSSVVKVISSEHNELFAEYTITQDLGYFLLYTSSDGKIVTPHASSSFDATILSNTYKDGVGAIHFNAPITTIGEGAFYGCSSLTRVTIGDSVTTIGERAFNGCNSLTSVTIGDSVTTIGENAFRNCSSLTSITVPDSVTSIGEYAFLGCISLTSITVPDSVTSIGEGAFRYCSRLASITIPDSVTSIGEYAFLGCISLTSITIPDSVTSIGNYAFYGCSNLTSITIPDSVTSIGSYAFIGCSSLTSITIPDSVTSIGEYAFRDCSNLTSITIPNSVTSIGSYAFYDCSNLTSITIPNSVTSIGTYTFSGCNSLKSIYCKPTTPPSGEWGMFYGNAYARKIYVPMESVSLYKSANVWKDYASDIVGYNF